MAKRAWSGRARGMLRACLVAAVLGALLSVAPAANAADLSDKSVEVLMNYAWAVMPKKFTTPDGKVIEVDKSKKAEIIVPKEVAREVIKVARLTAHASICKLEEKQSENYRTLMKREADKKTWTDQQLLYINQLHLFTVMWLTGNVEIKQEGEEKEVVVDEGNSAEREQTCTDAQKAKVEEQINAYIKGS